MTPFRAVSLVLAVWMGAQAGSLPSAAHDTRERTPAEDQKTEVDRWIAQLGSRNYTVREAAQRRLLEREDAIPALRRSLNSSDAEVRRRAAEVLDGWARKRAQRTLDRLVALGKGGEVDQVIEGLLCHPSKGEEDACWEVVVNLAEKVRNLGASHTTRVNLEPSDEVPFPSFRRYKAVVRPTLIFSRQATVQKTWAYTVAAEEIFMQTNTCRSILVASGNIHLPQIIHSSIILSGGDIRQDRDNSIGNSIVICGGTLDTKGSIHDCIVLARGEVKCGQGVDNCLIISGGKVQISKGASVSHTVIKEGESVPLRFVRFFDPARAGIEIDQAEGGVRIKAATEGKRFARAGLKAGDVVTALDGIAVKSAESFRALLRRKLAEGGEGKLKVRRGEKTLQISVPWKD